MARCAAWLTTWWPRGLGYTNRRSLRFGQEKSPEAQARIGTIVRILRVAETALQKPRHAMDGGLV